MLCTKCRGHFQRMLLSLFSRRHSASSCLSMCWMGAGMFQFGNCITMFAGWQFWTSCALLPGGFCISWFLCWHRIWKRELSMPRHCGAQAVYFWLSTPVSRDTPLLIRYICVVFSPTGYPEPNSQCFHVSISVSKCRLCTWCKMTLVTCSTRWIGKLSVLTRIWKIQVATH